MYAHNIIAMSVFMQEFMIFISPNEVFGDIMVLASPPRPPVDPDNVNTLTRQIFNLSLSNFIYEGRYPP